MDNEQKQPRLLDHEYDGIQELDNSLPLWWRYLFYITIYFAAGYLIYYHVAHAGPLQEGEYQNEMRAGASAKAAATTRFEAGIPTLKPSSDAMVLDQGRQTYAKMCAPCHRADGGGLVGPNLTDDYWIHGNAFSDSVKVIWDGVPAKGMVTWKATLKPDEIYAVASYIYTLRGAKLATPGKPPENLQAAKPAAASTFE